MGDFSDKELQTIAATFESRGIERWQICRDYVTAVGKQIALKDPEFGNRVSNANALTIHALMSDYMEDQRNYS